MQRQFPDDGKGGDMPHAPSFARDIRPLFTDQDIQHMSFAFDLSAYQDVKNNSAGILDRVSRDTNDPLRMPKAPRDLWTKEMIQMFQDWINGGFPP
jgi:hypothetical protein